jgi:hypothetical protein
MPDQAIGVIRAGIFGDAEKWIAERRDSSLSLESLPGEGSSFRFALWEVGRVSAAISGAAHYVVRSI